MQSRRGDVLHSAPRLARAFVSVIILMTVFQSIRPFECFAEPACPPGEDPLACAAKMSLTLNDKVQAASDLNGGCPGSPSPPPTLIKKLVVFLEKNFELYGQATNVTQAHPGFKSPYQGAQSMTGNADVQETSDVTLYGGARLWKGAEVWINPEIDQGFGLSNSFGVAGFTSGEAYKVGQTIPYFKLPRLFLRQTINIDGDKQDVDSAQNQMKESQTANRFVLTLGKFAVTDVFDGNKYAHDARHDFLNWSILDAGSFDFAADAWGFTYGASGELYAGKWALRGGVFAMSTVPNSTEIDTSGKQLQYIGEIERSYKLGGQDGKVKILVYLTHADMGSYEAAIAQGQATGQTPNTTNVREMQNKAGVTVNVEQGLSKNVGAFFRAGTSNGKVAAFDFTDITSSVSGGVSVNGTPWKRNQDTFRLGAVANLLSPEGIAYLNAGGLGIVVGDGQLPHPGPEAIGETGYDFHISPIFGTVSVDYQLVTDPAYNRDRGPINIFGVRLHGEW